jgi:hypothetical protein
MGSGFGAGLGAPRASRSATPPVERTSLSDATRLSEKIAGNYFGK